MPRCLSNLIDQEKEINSNVLFWSQDSRLVTYARRTDWLTEHERRNYILCDLLVGCLLLCMLETYSWFQRSIARARKSVSKLRLQFLIKLHTQSCKADLCCWNNSMHMDETFVNRTRLSYKYMITIKQIVIHFNSNFVMYVLGPSKDLLQYRRHKLVFLWRLLLLLSSARIVTTTIYIIIFH
jgi:hypothetical protein